MTTATRPAGERPASRIVGNYPSQSRKLTDLIPSSPRPSTPYSKAALPNGPSRSATSKPSDRRAHRSRSGRRNRERCRPRATASSPRLRHQLRRVEPELLGGFLDGLALVGRLDGAHPLEPRGEPVDCPRRLRG